MGGGGSLWEGWSRLARDWRILKFARGPALFLLKWILPPALATHLSPRATWERRDLPEAVYTREELLSLMPRRAAA